MLLFFQNLLLIPTNFPPLWDFKIMIRPNGRTQLTPLVKNWKGKLQAWDQGCTGCLIPTDLGLPDIPSTPWEPSLVIPVSKIWIILFSARTRMQISVLINEKASVQTLNSIFDTNITKFCLITFLTNCSHF